MRSRLVLESFDRSAGARSPAEHVDPAIESAKSTAFEAGYASGWEDAVSSDKTSRLKLEAEFARNIENLTFTFAEAVAHVRAELTDLVDALIEQFLPAIAPELLLGHIRTELLKLGDGLTDVPIELVTSPDCNPAVAEMLDSEFSTDLQIIEDPALADGQIFLRLGTKEMEIDLQPLIQSVSAQLKALRAESETEGATNA